MSALPNIKMLQGFVRPEQFTAITDWNITRNKLAWKEGLEYDMLKEEFREYYDDLGLVKKLDAIADVLFVGVGTVAKGTYNFGVVVPNFTEELDIIVSDFAGRCSLEGIALENIGPIISEALSIVIDANAKKLAEKNSDGKVQKPEGFVGPEAQLQKLLDSHKNAPTVADIFPKDGGEQDASA